MQTSRRCRQCGSELSQEDRFCAQCGERALAPSPLIPQRETFQPPKEDGISPPTPRKSSPFRKFLWFFLVPLLLLAGAYLLALVQWNGTFSNALYRERAVALAFDPSGRSLAGGCADGIIRLWDPGSGLERGRISAGPRGVTALAFGPRPGTLTCWDYDGTIILLDINKGTRIGSASRSQNREGAFIAFSADLGTVAVEVGKDAVSLCDPFKGTTKRIIPTDSVSSLALSWDGRILAIGRDWDVVFIEGWTGRNLGALKISAMVNALCFSPDGSTLAAGGFKRDIDLFDVASGANKSILPGTGLFLESLAFSPDGRILAAAGGTGGGTWGIFLYDVGTGKRTKTIRQAPLWKRTLALAGF